MAADTWTFCAKPADEQREPEDGEQQAPRRSAGASSALRRSPHRRATVRITATAASAMRDGHDGVDRAAAGDQGADDGQVDRHRQVFDDEQVQDGGRLPVAEPVEVGEHLGHDARRADPTHAAEEHGRGRLPAEDEADDEARREVGDRVDDAGNRAGAKSVAQLVGAVLEAEREQQEEHADLAGEMDEVGADVERRDAALADGESGEQVERDGGDAEPRRRAERAPTARARRRRSR